MSTSQSTPQQVHESIKPVPRVAVCLATYRGQAYLAKQLDSLFAQSYPNFNLYVHDDGSTDDTMKILKQYAATNSNMHILNYPPVGGAAANFLSMLPSVVEDYLFFCDQDDIWKPDKIEKSLYRLLTREAVVIRKPLLVFTDLELIDANQKVIASSYWSSDVLKRSPLDVSYQQLIGDNIASGNTLLINRPLIDLMKEKTQIPRPAWLYHDHLAMLLASMYGEILYFDEVLVQYRMHGENVVGAAKVAVNQNFLQRWKSAKESFSEYYLMRIYALGHYFLGRENLPKPVIDTLTELVNIEKRRKFARFLFFLKHPYMTGAKRSKVEKFLKLLFFLHD